VTLAGSSGTTHERARLEHELSRELGRCVGEFELLSEGDRVMVCLSGGKDSYTMLVLLDALRKRAPIDFTLVAVHLDQGHPGYDGTPLSRWLQQQGFEHRIVHEDTYKVVKANVPEGKTYCSLCSRLRRGVLYNVAQELGCTKIALGHHRDDAIETLMMNLMFTGSLRAMPPKLVSDDGRNVVIRPLMYCAEEKIARYAQLAEFPILPCDLCGSQEQLMRKQVKALLAQLDALAPRAKESMLSAMGNVKPSQLLDKQLWQALGLPVVQPSAAAPVLSPADSASDGAPSPQGPRRLPLLDA
jgi:tRNA 2-thiocytidine biosynthesis protein TtcA